ncbi:MAG: DNA alkylation repair protein [archaeon]|jgi:3-methyladenine DNA glycosylase AlkD
MNKQLKLILEDLKKKGDSKKAIEQKRYLKSPYQMYGIWGKDQDSAVKQFYLLNKEIDNKELFKILEDLWKSKWHTEKSFAIGIATYYTDQYTEKELLFFKKWLDECTGWDHTDGISGFIIARMVVDNSKLKKVINSWTKENCMWTRRASLISYIRSLRKDNRDLQDVFNNIKPLMHEKEFFIRKAIGWVLREASKKYSKEVIAFVKENKDELSNLSKREALKTILLKKELSKYLS